MSLLRREGLLAGPVGKPSRTTTLVTTGLFLAYTVLGLIVLRHHEPWRDEAQAWLIARDLGFHDMLFKQMAHEGSPALWHLLNRLLIDLGLPYASQAYLNFAFAVGTVGIIFWRAPFSTLVKFLFAFNYYLAFEYAQIARNYALGTFLLVVILALFEQRHQRPILYAALIALLANANVFMFLVAFAFGVLHAIETVRRGRYSSAVLPTLIMAAAGLLAVVQMMPADDNFRTDGALGLFNQFKLEGVRVATYDLFFASLDQKIRASSLPWPVTYGIVVAMGVFVVAFWALFLLHIRASWASLLFFVIVVGGILYLIVFKKGELPRVHGHILLAAMAALWLQAALHQPVAALRLARERVVSGAHIMGAFTVLLTVGLGLSVVRTGWNWYKEIRYPFSGAQEMAAYLQQTGLDRWTIVAYESAFGSAVLPYLGPDKMLYYPDVQRFGSYLVWTREWRQRYRGLPFDEVLRSTKADLGTLDNVLFLMSQPVDDPRVELLHSVAQNVHYETYYLYRPCKEPQ